MLETEVAAAVENYARRKLRRIIEQREVDACLPDEEYLAVILARYKNSSENGPDVPVPSREQLLAGRRSVETIRKYNEGMVQAMVRELTPIILETRRRTETTGPVTDGEIKDAESLRWERRLQEFEFDYRSRIEKEGDTELRKGLETHLELMKSTMIQMREVMRDEPSEDALWAVTQAFHQGLMTRP